MLAISDLFNIIEKEKTIVDIKNKEVIHIDPKNKFIIGIKDKARDRAL
jgi:hypothetical protein